MRVHYGLASIILVFGCGSNGESGLMDVKGIDTPLSWDLQVVGDTNPVDTRSIDLRPRVDTSPGDDTTDVDIHTGPDTVGIDTLGSCGPGTQCWADQWVIQASKVTFVVNETAFNPDWYLLDVLPPANLDVPVEVRSSGMNPLNLVSIFLEEGSNPHVSLLWTGDVQPGDLPLELMAPGTGVHLTIRYAPPAGTTEAGPAFLTVWSGDPDHPSRSLKLPVKQPGPDIDASLNWSNYGCSNYCHARPFELFNAGTEPLVIQSASFAKPSGEWSIQPAIPAGLTLVPAGQAGTTTFAFEAAYCDADGSYSGDSNELRIYSNDPDENPYKINLTVMAPSECP